MSATVSGTVHRSPVRARLRLPGFTLATTLALVVGMSGLVAAADGQPPTRAWLDSPLPGSVLPLGPVSVVAHAAHPSGIVRVELLADGVVVDAIAFGDTLSTFLVTPFVWSPPAPGPYALAVRAQSAAAGWSDAAGAGITVADGEPVPPSERPSPTATASASAGRSESPAASPTGRATPSPTATPRPTPNPTPRPTSTTRPTPTPTPTPTPSPTPTPTPSPTPTPTPSPTPAPCTPPAPGLLSPSDGFEIRDPGLNPPTLRWDYRLALTCEPGSHRVQVSTSRDFSTLLYDVVVSGAARAWTPPDALPDCQTYAWRVIPRRSDGTNGPSSAIWTFTMFVGRCG